MFVTTLSSFIRNKFQFFDLISSSFQPHRILRTFVFPVFTVADIIRIKTKEKICVQDFIPSEFAVIIHRRTFYSPFLSQVTCLPAGCNGFRPPRHLTASRRRANPARDHFYTVIHANSPRFSMLYCLHSNRCLFPKTFSCSHLRVIFFLNINGTQRLFFSLEMPPFILYTFTKLGWILWYPLLFFCIQKST